MDNVAYVEPNISNLQPIYASQITGSFQEFQLGAGAKAIKMDRSGMWMGAELFADAPFSVDMAGNVWANSIYLNGVDSTLLTSAIDANGNFIHQLITDTLNTQTKKILGEYSFQGLGAIAIKTDANNGIWISPTGILAKNAGNTKFALDNAGNATFGGTLVAASGTFGTITSGSIHGVDIKATSSSSSSNVHIYVGAHGGQCDIEYGGVQKMFMAANNTTSIIGSTTDLVADSRDGLYLVWNSDGGSSMMQIVNDTTVAMEIDDGNDTWFDNNVSAASFTDRTPHYEGNALEELKGIKGKKVKGKTEIDHDTLPSFMRRDRKVPKTKKEKKNGKIIDSSSEEYDIIPERDLGATISMLVKAVQELDEKIENINKNVI